MSRLKELKYFTLVMLLCGFVAAGSLSSCREQKKENAEEQAEHPEDEEHPAEDASAKEEHPEGEEHPAKKGEEEHPEGEEHPKDSVSG